MLTPLSLSRPTPFYYPHTQLLVQHMVRVHISVSEYSTKYEQELRRQNHVTPKNYLDYINNYSAQLNKFRDELGARYTRLDTGLEKLIEAATQVKVMKGELSEKKVWWWWVMGWSRCL